MSQTVLAVVLGRYPVPQYLENWIRALHKSEFPVRIFARRLDCRNPEGVQLLRPPTGSTRAAAALLSSGMRWPGLCVRWCASARHVSPPRRARLWANFAPLLAARPDVIHLVNSYLFPAFAQLAARIPQWVVSFRGFDTVIRPWTEPFWRDSLQTIFETASCLHFVSEYLKHEAVQLGAPEKKCVVIHPSVPPDFLTSKSTAARSSPNGRGPDGALRLITVGRLVWQKGHVYGLQAVRHLRGAGLHVRYRVVGEGPELQHLEFWRRTLGLEDCVEFAGEQNAGQVRQLLAESDIYVHPSVTEALGVAVLEASAMGLPVAAARVGGLPEVVEDGKTGVLVPPADSTRLAEAMMALARDPELCARMGREGRRLVTEKFTVEREMNQWVKIYSSLALI